MEIQQSRQVWPMGHSWSTLLEIQEQTYLPGSFLSALNRTFRLRMLFLLGVYTLISHVGHTGFHRHITNLRWLPCQILQNLDCMATSVSYFGGFFLVKHNTDTTFLQTMFPFRSLCLECLALSVTSQVVPLL